MVLLPVKYFTKLITATKADIDRLGHVNNAVWVSWVQDVAVAHWQFAATAEQKRNYIWVVTRHEIDYRGNVELGDTVRAQTWLEGPPNGARINRRVRFADVDGLVKVEALTTWALLDADFRRPIRIGPDITDLFLAE
jgi:acyl-CoA thioester hydrolase